MNRLQELILREYQSAYAETAIPSVSWKLGMWIVILAHSWPTGRTTLLRFKQASGAIQFARDIRETMERATADMEAFLEEFDDE